MPSTTRALQRLCQGLALALLLTLAACGGQEPGNSTPAAGSVPEQAEPAAATPEPAEPAATAEAAEPAAEAAAEAGVQENAAADSNSGEQLKLAGTAPQGEPNWRFKEGEHFTVLTTAQGTTSAPGKIEVTEAFWYGCPHCYEFDPLVSEWAARLPGDVAFVRLPVMWNPTNQIHARVFYTAMALGKLEEMHTAIFREMHIEKKQVTDEAEIQQLFARFGVSEADFRKTFRSFAVEGQLKRAKDLTNRYQVRSVPLIIVDGKYLTSGPGIRNYEEILQVASELVERERRR